MQNNDKTAAGGPGSDDKPKSQQSDEVRARADERKARLAKTLRDNLARRKQQSRARRSGAADETDGLPAAKTDESED